MSFCHAAGIDITKQFWKLNLTQTRIMMDGAKIRNLKNVMPGIRRSVNSISDEALKDKNKKAKNTLLNIERGMILDQEIINADVPDWFAAKLLSIGTLENLSTRSARAILELYNAGKFRPQVTREVAKFVLDGSLQRTANL